MISISLGCAVAGTGLAESSVDVARAACWPVGLDDDDCRENFG
jgi:hypothetical protein